MTEAVPDCELISLKTYSSNEWMAFSRHKYRLVFIQERTGFIYFEAILRNLNYLRRDFQLNLVVVLQKRVYNARKDEFLWEDVKRIDASREVAKTEAEIRVSQGYGTDKPNGYWRYGKFRYVAELEGKMIGDREFFVQDEAIFNDPDQPPFTIGPLEIWEGPEEFSPTTCVPIEQIGQSSDIRFLHFRLPIRHLQKNDLIAGVRYLLENDQGDRKIDYEKVTIVKGDCELDFFYGTASNGTWQPENYWLKIFLNEQLLCEQPLILPPNSPPQT
ncbi:MAG: hypothetical protein H6581_25715 [Bacteroidia bacterium]|nr:hypothetical protein [Bacteroidia bacterium]